MLPLFKGKLSISFLLLFAPVVYLHFLLFALEDSYIIL